MESLNAYTKQVAHTPGPWVIDDDGEVTLITVPGGDSGVDNDVAEVYGGNGNDPQEQQANARLIAAAPDLLEALQAMNVPDYPLADVPANRKWILAQRAIAKAEGRGQ